MVMLGCKSSGAVKKGTSDNVPVEKPRSQEHSMKTVIVSLAHEMSDQEVKDLAEDYNLLVTYNYSSFNMCALSSSEELSETELSDLIRLLSADSRVINVERDYVIQLDDMEK